MGEKGREEIGVEVNYGGEDRWGEGGYGWV